MNKVTRLYSGNICIIFIIKLTFIQDRVLVRVLEVSYDIPSMMCTVMEAYDGQ